MDVQLSGHTFQTPRIDNVYDDVGNLIASDVHGYIGVTEVDLGVYRPLPAGWTDEDVVDFLDSYQVDIFNPDSLDADSKYADHYDEANIDVAGTMEWYINEHQKVVGTYGEYSPEVLQFRAENAQAMYDSFSLEMQEEISQTLAKKMTMFEGSGLKSSFSSAYSEGDTPIQAFTGFILAITGKFADELKVDYQRMMRFFNDPRVISKYDVVNSELSSMKIGLSTISGEGSFVNTVTTSNKNILGEVGQDLTDDMLQHPAYGIAVSGNSPFSNKDHYDNDIVKQIQDDITSELAKVWENMDSLDGKTSDIVQEGLMDLLKPNSKFEEINFGKWGDDVDSINWGRYERPQSHGWVGPKAKGRNANGSPRGIHIEIKSTDELLENLRGFFYIEKSNVPSHIPQSNRYLEEGFKSVFDVDPAIWESFKAGTLATDYPNIQIRMAREMRNTNPGAINFEQLIFNINDYKSVISNGLDPSTVKANIYGPQVYLLSAIMQRTRLLQNGVRPFAKGSDEYIQAYEFWRKVVVAENLGGRPITIGMIDDGVVDSAIDFDLDGWGNHLEFDSLAEMLELNNFYKNELIAPITTQGADEITSVYYYIKKSPGSSDTPRTLLETRSPPSCGYLKNLPRNSWIH